MSQAFSRPNKRQIHHILIIDDSARLRQNLAELIVSNCLAAGNIYRVFHSDKDGKFTQSNEMPNPAMLVLGDSGPAAPNDLDEFVIYTAPSPKQALFVINSPLFTKLTIISDVMMPADTEVGLIGMLEAIARRSLPVNLVFASTDAQNIFVVAKLVEAGKAYFVVKQGSAWEDLSRALVRRTGSFRFKTITSLDFEGMQKLAGLVKRKPAEFSTAPEPEQLTGRQEVIPAYSSPVLPQLEVRRPQIKPVKPALPAKDEPAPVHNPIFASRPNTTRPLSGMPEPRTPTRPVFQSLVSALPPIEIAPEPSKPAQNHAQVQAEIPQPKREADLAERSAANATPPMPTWDDLVNGKEVEVAPEPESTAPTFETAEEEALASSLAWEDLITPRTKQRLGIVDGRETFAADSSGDPTSSVATVRPDNAALRPVAEPPQRKVFPLFRPFVALAQLFKRI